MDKPITKKKEIKAETVKTISEKLDRAKTVIFVNYHHLSANQIATLRNKVKETGGELIITKNTLIARALSINHLPSTINQLTGPTAVIFVYQDEIAPIKEIAEVAKSTGFPKFKFGLAGSDFLDLADIENLAKIPSHHILNVQIVKNLNFPIYGLVSALGANIRNLVFVLDQKAQSGSS